MTTTTTAGVYMLAEEHAAAIQRLASDPTLARMLAIAQPLVATAGADTIARASSQRIAGEAYWNAVVDQREVHGFSALLGPYGNQPTIAVWIEPVARRRGYGELAARLALDFAFRNLQLAAVYATADVSDAAQTRMLSKFGFTPANGGAGEPETLYRLTRSEWVTHRDAPAIARLHPSLRSILDAELAAGNAVAETGGGWPDPDSVFIRLRDPFRTKPDALPSDVVYTEPNDPHWWKADYSSTSPRHILAS